MTIWKTTVLAASVAFAVTVPAFAADTDANTVVATVNGTPVTLGHMIALRDTLPEQYLELPDDVLFNGILDQLTQQVAISEVAEAKITLRDKLALDNHRRTYLSGVILDETAEAAVTDEALQALFAEKYANAAPSKEFSAAHILVETEEQAKKIVEDLNGGADFADLARANSTDPGSAANGGDLGWFGLGMMVEPFEAAVVTLEPGQLSAPVQTQFGWHVIKLAETRLAEGPTLDEKRDELAAELQEKAIEAKLAELTAGAEIVKTTDGIDPAILKNSALLDN